MNTLLEKIFGEDFNIIEYEERIDVFRKYQRYVYIVLLVLTAIYLIFGKIVPSYGTYLDNSKRLRTYTKIFKEKQKEVLDKENIAIELSRLKSLINEKKQLFFSTNDYHEFSINKLPLLCDQFGTKLLSIQYSEPKITASQLKLYQINLTLNGKFENIMNLLEILETFEKVIKVETLSLSRKSINPVIISTKVTLGIYQQ
jgi:hypothetical protein